MRLNEFLEQHLSPYMLIDQLDKQYNIIITPFDGTSLSWGTNTFGISRSDLKMQLEHNKMSVKKFEEIIAKFGWYISNISGNRLNLTVLNNLDNHYYSTTDLQNSNA